MNTRLLVMAVVPALLTAGDEAPSLTIRGRQQSVSLLASPSSASKNAVLFLPGDGGWRGMAIKLAQTVSSWGYDAYGFDTKRYLESFSQGGPRLSEAEMRRDLCDVVDWVRSRGANSVTVLGWSQGAAMALLAANDRTARVDGVLTLGLPESAVLGWNWKDTLAVLARQEPDEPHFSVKPLLPTVSPTPMWMIHGAQDEFTSPEATRSLYALAKEPKRLVEIDGGNHRFDGKHPELFKTLREGLEWVKKAAR